MDINWILLIPIVAIVGGVVYSIVSDRNRTKRAVAKAATPSEEQLNLLRDAADGNQRLLEQLARIENRIATIEKTLTEIP